MQKFLLIFGIAMSVVYLAAGFYFLFGETFGWTPVPFKFQAILGGLIMGYGGFRIVRVFNQLQKNNS